jgi:DNA-binding IclR family transcriptional regulator
MKRSDITSSNTPVSLEAGKLVGAAYQVTRLLIYGAQSLRPWTASEAAKSLDINPSTCFNLVQTLVAVGWLAPSESQGRSKRYVLGSGFLNLAHQVTARNIDMHSVMPHLQDYADRWKVTATIWHKQSLTRMELVAVAGCQTAVNVQMPIGQRLPILMGGMGRIMALQSGIESVRREALFGEMRWDRSLTYAQFMSQARKAKRLGWGVDDGYMNRSVTALSAPVIAGNDQDVEYVCSATMFRHQYASSTLPNLAAALVQVASEVSVVVCGQ